MASWAAAPPHAAAERRRLWALAIKLPIYITVIVPVLAGAAVAYGESCSVDWPRCLLLMLGSCCVLAWVNLSNDAFDAPTGVDKGKPESVVNLLGGNHVRVLVASKAFLATGLALLNAATRGPNRAASLRLQAAALACAYLYQGPPFRWSFLGLGEPLVFLAFGPFLTIAWYLNLTHLQHPAAPAAGSAWAAAAAPAALARWAASVPAAAWAAAGLVGWTTAVILFCSHFHQIEGDAAAGKRSPLVRLGPTAGARALRGLVGASYALAWVAALAGVLPHAAAVLALASAPAAHSLLRFCAANHAEPDRIAPLKRYAVRWHAAFSLALALALASTCHWDSGGRGGAAGRAAAVLLGQ